MPLTLASAVNDEQVLQSTLLRSHEISSVDQILLQRGFRSAAEAYNAAIAAASNDIIAFIHQDVYLPPGWMDEFERSLAWLARHAPNWGVLGSFGLTSDGAARGYIFSTGLRQFVGSKSPRPEPVRILDEVFLVIRRSSGIKFDTNLPGFHLYGTDVCLSAENLGLQNYALSCFSIHNSNGIRLLPRDYWKALFQLRRKWIARLPILSPCAQITSSSIPLLWREARTYLSSRLRRRHPGRRVVDVEKLYRELQEPDGSARLTSASR